MARKRKPTPSYLPHPQSGRAVWYDRAGVRQQRLLPGPFNSSESKAAYYKLSLELEVEPRGSDVAPKEGLTLV